MTHRLMTRHLKEMKGITSNASHVLGRFFNNDRMF